MGNTTEFSLITKDKIEGKGQLFLKSPPQRPLKNSACIHSTFSTNTMYQYY